MSDSAHPPIIIKKVSGHGGHHGGAWKVAYADFVTAMMALFIVLWLMASSEQVKKAIAAYFLDPKGTKAQTGSGMVGTGESMMLSKQDLSELEKKIQQALRKIPDMDQKLKDQVKMTITGEGLRIELLENSKGMFFQNGNAKPTDVAMDTIGVLGAELGKLPNQILIEGHTDATPYQTATGYSNWELSTDRANEARRIMQEHGVRQDQVKQVRGFADQNLRDKAHPTDASNRRISVIVSYSLTEKAAAELQAAQSKAAEKEAGKSGRAEKKPEAAEGKAAAAPQGKLKEEAVKKG